MSSLNDKVSRFVDVIKDVYRDPSDRTDINFPALSLSDDPSEDFLAMFYALYFMYYQLDSDADIIDFLGVCNKLVVEYLTDKER